MLETGRWGGIKMFLGTKKSVFIYKPRSQLGANYFGILLLSSSGENIFFESEWKHVDSESARN